MKYILSHAVAQIQHTATNTEKKTDDATAQDTTNDPNGTKKDAFNALITYTNPQPYHETYNPDARNNNKPFLNHGKTTCRIDVIRV